MGGGSAKNGQNRTGWDGGSVKNGQNRTEEDEGSGEAGCPEKNLEF